MQLRRQVILTRVSWAASEFFRCRKYDLDLKSPDDYSIFPNQIADLYKSFIQSIQCCPFGMCLTRTTRKLSRSAQQKCIASLGIQVVGNDIMITYPELIAEAVKQNSYN